MSRRIVISGLGAVCPRATGPTALWELFSQGDAGPPSSLAGRIPDAAFAKQSAQLRHMDRLGRIALTATTLAIEAAGPGNPLQTGIAFGSSYGCLPTNAEYLEGILERGGRYGNPVVFQNTVTNAATGYISMVHDLRGPTATLCSGHAAGLEALRFGCQQIEEGQAERMVVVAADTLSPMLMAGIALPEGMRVSEAACALVLEEHTQALARGAHRHAEVLGTAHRGGSLTNQAHTLARAVRDALHTARIAPEQLGAVFSCASGRGDFDGWEQRGLHEALGAHAAKVPVSCPKDVLGETFSTAGMLAVVLATRALDKRCALVTALGGEGSALAVVLRGGADD
ncbi:beta-ketoacyl synthase [Myxococcus xanthus]|uniref:beta-ketoacyl synthase N-terminal-like domain-containing protein n=1 Tax=Myxococcus xanthus TaxID=34 RepID=UPI00112968E8|nr:beta-ketoacyl synthase N-terminal-like domain-containing protein [Myxococcus xanthus]QDE92939.1 beta-ketoacyl synthase [Myxococcus xanthus]